MSSFTFFLILIAGFVTGFINTLAGGGSIISLSLLLFLGLPPNVANATNRLGILLQNMAAVRNFSRKGVLKYREGIGLALPTIMGAAVGASIARNISLKHLEFSIGVVMLLMALFILLKPQQWLNGTPPKERTIGRYILQGVSFFLMGLYGGYIQVGTGYFLLMGLVLLAGHDLVKANGLKVFIMLCYTPVAIFIFQSGKQIDWHYGLVLGAGNMMGGFLSSRLALKQGAGFIRWVLIITILFTALQSFGLVDLIQLLGLAQ
ncbi:MAG: hypothetical protein CSA95_03415 [Bacteroidetes bacterium]|nr:MAG: hypothetical protein CSA95_03415 [Bacteroidota bacterium]PIE87946.1 MAG: hypothetical protein CSA04_04410 [Bacteroidota bacterium]